MKNFNPGNIRVSADYFIGELKHSTGSFKAFKSYVYGVRALMVIIRTYYNRYGLNTVKSIISRYAPPIENRTDLYIDFVCKYMKCEPTTPLFCSSNFKGDLFSLVSAILIYESQFHADYSLLNEAYLLL